MSEVLKLELPESYEFLPLKILFDEDFVPDRDDWHQRYVLRELIKHADKFEPRIRWMLIYKAHKGKILLDKQLIENLLEDPAMLDPDNMPECIKNFEFDECTPIKYLVDYLTGRSGIEVIVDKVAEKQLPATILRTLPREEQIKAMVEVLDKHWTDPVDYMKKFLKYLGTDEVVEALMEYYRTGDREFADSRARKIVNLLDELVLLGDVDPDIIIPIVKLLPKYLNKEEKR